MSRSVAKSNNITINYGGLQYVEAGGRVSGTVIMSGGLQYLETGGKEFGTLVSSGGRQIVQAGGRASSTQVLKGGLQYIKNGGNTTNFNIARGAKQFVSDGGSSYKGKILGVQYASSGASITLTNVGKGEIQKIFAGAMVSATTVASSGTQTITSGAIAKNTTVQNAETITANNGATVSSLKLASGGSAEFNGNAKIVGSVASAGAILDFTKTNNRVTSLSTNAKTQINFDIKNLKALSTSYMLSATKKQKLSGIFKVETAKLQNMGTYEIGNNLTIAEGTAFTIDTASEKQGTVKTNSKISKNGVRYALESKDGTTKLTLTAISGSFKVGSNSSDTLKGSSNCDIFYGGQGNDNISGSNGRDISVYDSSNWGKDTIAKTNGTMTLLFKDLKSSDIVKKLSGTTMVISRKGNDAQSITINGWSNSTHNIVFNDNLTALSKYIATSNPNSTQTSAVRKEIWKLTGLATN